MTDRVGQTASNSLLLVGNILNNGYLHAKYLRRRGVPADCLNVDYRHCQGQPEWAEVEINQAVDEWNQDWSRIDLQGFQRPSWFLDLSLDDLRRMEAVPSSRRDGQTGGGDAPPVPRAGRLRGLIKSALLRLRLAPILKWHRRRLAKDILETLGADVKSIMTVAKGLCHDDRGLYPDADKALSIDDVLELMPRAYQHRAIFERYRLIHAFSLDPIYPMLALPGKPFLAYEHGTLREFPFEDSARGRLYRLALKKAEATIITNVDTKRSADRLGLERVLFCPHIIDDEIFRPGEGPLRQQLLADNRADFLILHPARHHWHSCPPGLEGSWFKSNDVFIRALARIRRQRPDLRPLVVTFEWGQEVELSKRLIAELGVGDMVVWLPICSKKAIVTYFNAADLVVDQFNARIGTFGAVVGEAFACAKPVILNYREELHRWCYPVLPPPAERGRRGAGCGASHPPDGRPGRLPGFGSSRLCVVPGASQFVPRHRSADIPLPEYRRAPRVGLAVMTHP